MEKRDNERKVNIDVCRARLVFGILACAFFGGKELFHLNNQPSFQQLLLEEDHKEYDGSSLYVVRYQNNYFITNRQLQVLEMDFSFHILNSENQKESFGIQENDVISFLTFVNVKNIKKETFTLKEAKYIVKSCVNKEDLFPSLVFDSNFELNENPTRYVMENLYSNKRLYDMEELYIIYNDGNLFLCTEENHKFYAINGDFFLPKFSFSRFKYHLKGTNYVTVEQIKSFSKYLDQFQSNKPTVVDIKEAYQLLQLGLEVVDSPFLQKQDYSYATSAQIKKAKEYLVTGYQFLDDYHNSNLKYYSLDQTYVIFLKSNQYVLIEDMWWDDYDNYYMLPLCSTEIEFKQNQEELNNIKRYGFTELPFITLADLVEENSNLYYGVVPDGNYNAKECYQLLEAYLAIHQNYLDCNKRISLTQHKKRQLIYPIKNNRVSFVSDNS